MARYEHGWIKLHRKLLKSDVIDDAAALAIWALLLMWANRKDGKTRLKGQLVAVKRGQVVTSARQIASKLKLHRNLVNRRLDDFENAQMLGRQTGHCGTIITITNYAVYQARGAEAGHQSGQTRATDGPVAGQSRTHSGEETRQEESREELNPTARAGAQAHVRVDPETAKLLGTGLAKRAEGAIRKRLTEAQAKEHIGAEGWAMISACYDGWEDFVTAFQNAYRSAAAPTVATAQLRDAFAADILIRTRNEGGAP